MWPVLRTVLNACNMAKPAPGTSFEFTHGSVQIRGERLDIPRQEVYRLVFSSPRPPLVVACAAREDGSFFWTSIPEGRQKEAEGAGVLLENFFKND